MNVKEKLKQIVNLCKSLWKHIKELYVYLKSKKRGKLD